MRCRSIADAGNIDEFARCAPFLLSNNAAIYLDAGIDDKAVAKRLLSGFQALNGDIPGLHIPWFLLVAVLIVAALWVVLNCTRLGRRLYAVGSNEEAARLSGVRVNWTFALRYGGPWRPGFCVRAATRHGGSMADTGITWA